MDKYFLLSLMLRMSTSIDVSTRTIGSRAFFLYLATITEELDGEIDISDTRRQIEANIHNKITFNRFIRALT